MNLDEGPRPTPRLEGLAKFKPVFAGTRQRHRRATAPRPATARRPDPGQRKNGQTVRPDPLAALCHAASGVPPRRSWASARWRRFPTALRYAGLQHSDIGWIELNEAFAAQSLAVINAGPGPGQRSTPWAAPSPLGRPLGATGAIRAATVVHALRRHNLKYGMVTMCVGTGQGQQASFERISLQDRSLST